MSLHENANSLVPTNPLVRSALRGFLLLGGTAPPDSDFIVLLNIDFLVGHRNYCEWWRSDLLEVVLSSALHGCRGCLRSQSIRSLRRDRS